MPNAVDLEIVRGGLESIVLEMRALIDRTAMSPIIKEKKDYFIGLYDVEGRMLAAHIAYTGPGLIQPLLRQYPVSDIRPGDVYWYNDPYLTDGAIQHLGDMCFIAPVFESERLVAFVASFGHFKDIGGTKAGSIAPSATEIFHEGTRVPPIRIYRQGILNEEAYRLFLANSRFPAELEGDTRALMAASKLGERRMKELFARVGAGKTIASWSTLIELNAAKAKQLLRSLVPEGEYHFWDCVDGDYVTDNSYKVEMTLRREGDQFTVDLSDSDAQAKGPVNFIATHGFINLLFGRFLKGIDDHLSINEGTLSVIDETITRPGTVVQPRFPAATGLRSHARLRISSCMLGVMNASTGGKAPANSPVYALYTIRIYDGESGEYDVLSEGVGSGLGARPFADGTDAIYFIGQKNFPVEFLEREHPVRVRRYAIVADSGGPGYYRGGCGVLREVELLAETGILATRFDNTKYPCWGVAGGRAGRPARLTLNPGTEAQVSVPTIGDNFAIARGDVLRIEACGGGGWGDPFGRPIDWVKRDVRRGFVSVEGARRDYGVVFLAESLDVDEEASARLRDGPRDVPMFDRGDVVVPKARDVR